MTPEQVDKLKQWLYSQAYIANSHTTDQGRCEWLRLDEMLEYLPAAVEQILTTPNHPTK